MLQLLAFGTFWFWVLVLIASIFIVVSIEDDEHNYGANLFFIGALLLLYFFGNAETFNRAAKYAIEEPRVVFLAIMGYFLAGTIWSVVKWVFWLQGRKRYHQRHSSNREINISDYKVANNTEKILHWMIYWPFSLVWTMINEPVKRGFYYILDRFSGLYDKLAVKILIDKENKTND